MADEIELTEDQKAQKAASDWLDKINTDASTKGDELTVLLGQKVTPFVFIVETLKDAAVGFLREPDAENGFKILRDLGVNYENGIKLIARSQLVRDGDVKAKGFEGIGSDPRFMDVNGKYDLNYSALNMSLLMKCQTAMRPFTDQFKKK